jgi:uncharacterized protein YcfJ
MRKNLLLAGFAVAALIPSLAMAQETCEQRSSNRAAGTVGGALVGALLGSAVAGHGEKGTGALVGAGVGGVIGNQASRGPRDCQHAFGYYDNDNRWHDNGADRAVAYGYYDRNGAWIDGPPNVSGYAANVAYTDRTNSVDVDTRINRINERIQQGRADGSLSKHEMRLATNTLSEIRDDENRYRRHGTLSDHETAQLQQRLDDLSAKVHMDRQN